MKEKLKNRFVLTAILIVVFSLLGFIININEENWLLNTEAKLTPWFNIKFFGLLLSSYELFLIITNDNKTLSKFASVVLVFSSLVAYNFNKIDSLLFGSIIIVLLNKLLLSNSQKHSVVLSIFIIAFSVMYSYTYIPYAVSFGYVFIGLIIFLIIKNKNKIGKNKCIIIVSTFLISILIMICTKFIYSNNYFDNENLLIDGISMLFSYIYSPLLLFKNVDNSNLLSSIYSLWPLPILISLLYLYKNEKHIDFLLPVTAIGVLETVFSMIQLPEIIQKILFINNVYAIRMAAGIEFSCLLIMFYFLANIKEKIFSMSASIRITLVFALLLIFVKLPSVFANRRWLSFFVIEIVALAFSFFNIEKKEYRLFFCILLAIISVISGVPVYIQL